MWDEEKLHVISGLLFSCNVLNRTLPQTHYTLVLFGKRLCLLRFIQQALHKNINFVEIVYNKRFSNLLNLFFMQCNDTKLYSHYYRWFPLFGWNHESCLRGYSKHFSYGNSLLLSNVTRV